MDATMGLEDWLPAAVREAARNEAITELQMMPGRLAVRYAVGSPLVQHAEFNEDLEAIVDALLARSDVGHSSKREDGVLFIAQGEIRDALLPNAYINVMRPPGSAHTVVKILKRLKTTKHF